MHTWKNNQSNSGNQSWMETQSALPDKHMCPVNVFDWLRIKATYGVGSTINNFELIIDTINVFSWQTELKVCEPIW